MGHAPVKNTCPDIDALLDELDDLQADVAGKVKAIKGALEDLRKDNETLRQWGHEQADLAEKLEEKVQELEEEIESLKAF